MALALDRKRYLGLKDQDLLQLSAKKLNCQPKFIILLLNIANFCAYVYWVIHDSTPSKEFKLRGIITEEKEIGTRSRGEAVLDNVCFHLIEV
ncbi:hypothetical protein CFP56_007718 [Quercus suber]|uniref:Uncharacterized protein n=1 Tax=Quercus suber TaxID=58331 RepID=A0AAW0M8S0_QUESU